MRGPQFPLGSIVYFGVHVVDFYPIHQHVPSWNVLSLLGRPYSVRSRIFWIQACVNAWLASFGSALSIRKKRIRRPG